MEVPIRIPAPTPTPAPPPSPSLSRALSLTWCLLGTRICLQLPMACSGRPRLANPRCHPPCSLRVIARLVRWLVWRLVWRRRRRAPTDGRTSERRSHRAHAELAPSSHRDRTETAPRSRSTAGRAARDRRRAPVWAIWRCVTSAIACCCGGQHRWQRSSLG